MSKKEFKNCNRTFRSHELRTWSDMSLRVLTTTTYSVDSEMNPIKADEDKVYVELIDDEQYEKDDRPHFLLSKEQVLDLISALSKAALKLRDDVNLQPM